MMRQHDRFSAIILLLVASAAALSPTMCEQLPNFTIAEQDVPGNPPLPANTSAECCQLCANVPLCLASVFNGSACRFKTGTTAQYLPGSEVLFQIPAPTQPPSPAPVGPAGTVIWSFTTANQVQAQPTSQNGVVYCGSLDGSLYAVDARDGLLIWNFTTQGSIYSAATLNGNELYFGSEDYNVYALDTATGSLLWNFTTGYCVFGTPAYDRPSGIVYAGSYDNSVYALNASAGGKLVWNFTTGGLVRSSPIVHGGVVYVGSEDHALYALNGLTGKMLWKFVTQGWIVSTPMFHDGVIYIGSEDFNMYAVDASSGQLVWQFATGFQIDSTPVVVESVLFFGSDDDCMYALDLPAKQQHASPSSSSSSMSPTLKWKYCTKGWVYSSPAVAQGIVYVGSLDSYVYALNATSGAVVWMYETLTTYATGYGVWSSPTVLDGVVYIGSNDQKLYAISAK